MTTITADWAQLNDLMEDGLQMAVHRDGAGPLHLLAGSSSEHSYSTALVLLERGADPNARTIDGLTPVHIACEWGQYELLRLLLLSGGDPSLRTNDGRTAFDLATQQKNYFCVELLRRWQETTRSPMKQESSAHITPSSRFHRSPLHEAADDNVSLDLSINSGPEEDYDGRFAQFRRVETPKLRAPKLSEKVVRRLHFSCCLPDLSATTPSVKENDASQLTPPYERPQLISTHTQYSLPRESLHDLCTDLSEDVTLADDLETTVREKEVQTAREVSAEKLGRTLRMSDETLRRELTNRGIDVGPIVQQTRGLYAHRLACLLDEEEQQAASGVTSPNRRRKFSVELEAAISGRLNMEIGREDETALVTHFDESVAQGRPWREGVLKMSFCYILLDPVVLQRLPSLFNDSDRFRCFVDAIFYIGKGKRSRPYQHLIEAATLRQNRRTPDDQQMSDKTRRIVTLWDRGYGVVSLHVFQNTIPVEAYAREAAMIDAIGLSNLTNIRRGDYYGAAVAWTTMRRRRFGCYLLKQAMTALDVEGFRQLFPTDII